MVSVDGNLYSIPNGLRRRSVQIERTATELRILDADEVIAIHALLMGRGKRQIIDAHRARVRAHRAVAPRPQSRIGVAGDEICQRGLEVYDSIAERLAQGESA